MVQSRVPSASVARWRLRQLLGLPNPDQQPALLRPAARQRSADAKNQSRRYYSSYRRLPGLRSTLTVVRRRLLGSDGVAVITRRSLLKFSKALSSTMYRGRFELSFLLVNTG